MGRVAGRMVRAMVLRVRVRQGWSRVHAAFFPVLQAAVAVAIAYLVSRAVLGHHAPFFAGIAAWACLGFSFDRDLRKIAEVAFGVVFGVSMGDLVVSLIGSGWWQLSTVLVVAALTARFIDRGAVLTAQSGTQAIVIVGLPALSGGPYSRAGDALVGGVVALAIALLTPADPRRGLRTLGNVATTALAAVVELAAAAVRGSDDPGLQVALVRARAADPALSEWMDRTHHALDQARVSVNRVHRDELERLQAQAVLVERAMRSVRVLVRRAPASLGHATPEDRATLADLLDRYAAGIRLLASAVTTGQDAGAARTALADVARDADPHAATEDWGTAALIMVLRSPVVDVLEAAGATPEAARAALRDL